MSGPRLLEVLRQLSHEDFVSGADLARRMGCSRATVHNALAQAQDAGVRVHAVKGRGYRLPLALSWLDLEGLRARLAKRGMSPELFETLPSTNSHLMARAQAGAPHRSVAVAEWQTGGRGRRGRVWLAPPGSGIQFSLLWRFGRSVAELSGLSLAIGVLLVRALQGLGLRDARVKWPNDVVVGDAKLAGVLIELGGDMLGPASAVIGVGLNVCGAETLGPRVGQAVTDLRAHLGAVDRTTVLRVMVEALDAGLAQFDAEGFSAFSQDWHACHAHQGREVALTDGQGARVFGIAQGVDEQGALWLRTDEGVRRFHAGEVSLRGAAA
ncbi:MAG: biotin--[acetyl-CoA-carboxylase] ligase [Betaproteobacteria bacterium]|nr:biotin--[acetyl-CoA-carboxylase] ligase [Betaproteobacteria bacterium]